MMSPQMKRVYRKNPFSKGILRNCLYFFLLSQPPRYPSLPFFFPFSKYLRPLLQFSILSFSPGRFLKTSDQELQEFRADLAADCQTCGDNRRSEHLLILTAWRYLRNRMYLWVGLVLIVLFLALFLVSQLNTIQNSGK